MRKEISAMLFIAIFIMSTVATAHANVSIDSTIEENIYVVINITNLNQTIYDAAKTSPTFNGSALVQTIVQNLRTQGHTMVTNSPQVNGFDDANRAIQVSFFLGGIDIISSAVNRTTLKRNFQVQTDWRKFQVSLTSNISIDFATYFAESVDKWQQLDFTDSNRNVHPSYYYETEGTEQLGKMSFRFILPSAATNVQATGDTITYDISLGFEDVFVGSPFPILAIVIIVVLIALVYRRLR